MPCHELPRRLAGVRDRRELPPHERQRGPGPDEREPERRGEPPPFGDDPTERLPDDQPEEQPANTDLRNAAGWMTAAGWADDSSRAVDDTSEEGIRP